jgi:hypothetical protein
LSTSTPEFIKTLVDGPLRVDPLSETEHISTPEDVVLSTGGSICLLAYWVFSATVFDADQPSPAIWLFPEHFALLEQLLEDNAQLQIHSTPGTVEALVALGLWLEDSKLISTEPPAAPQSPTSPVSAVADDDSANFMTYHHLLTLIAVYHPALAVRNAAAALAGAVLHADPVDTDRLRILEDLLENCMFAHLKACAVVWLREELVAAASPSVFAGPEALDTIQYAVFPNLDTLADLDLQGLRDYWVANGPFLLQTVNFALFLWPPPQDGVAAGAGSNKENILPQGMDAAVGERWVRPLWAAAEALVRAEDTASDAEPARMELEVLRERLRRLLLSDRFKALGLESV